MTTTDHQALRNAIDELDLESWLSDYTEVKDGGGHERRIRSCPKCLNDNFKLYVNISIKRWICYVCDWGKLINDPVVLMAEISGRTLFDIRKELLQTVIPAPVDSVTAKLQQIYNNVVTKIQNEYLALDDVPGDEFFTGPVGEHALAYAHFRGLQDDEINLYKLRSASRLRKFSGKFLVFPLWRGQQIFAWQGRSTGEAEPKYVSSDDIANWVWPLDDIFSNVVRERGETTLVEGVFDSGGLWRIGEPAHCTFGKKINAKQITLLKTMGVKKVRLCWDEDATRTSEKRLLRGLARGLRGETEQAALLLRRHFEVDVVDLSNQPKFEGVKKADPGEILRSAQVADWIRERLKSAMSVDSSEFQEWRLS